MEKTYSQKKRKAKVPIFRVTTEKTDEALKPLGKAALLHETGLS